MPDSSDHVRNIVLNLSWCIILIFLLIYFSPDGYLYDKESVLSYILNQKLEIARKLKKYEKDRKNEERELQELAEKEQNDKMQKFVHQEVKVFRDNPGVSSSSSSVSNMSGAKEKQLPSFWIPNLTPSTSKAKVKKPSSVVLCPMSGKPMKANQLISVTFTPVDPKCTDPMKVGIKCISVDTFNIFVYKFQAQYKCAVTHDILTNSSKCVVLRTS